MSTYQWSICDPAQPDIIEKGLIPEDKIMDTFLSYPWATELSKANDLGEKAMYSPSLEFENRETGQSITFSIVGDEEDNEFYIFYKRSSRNISDITGQRHEDAVQFLQAFLSGDTALIEAKLKG